MGLQAYLPLASCPTCEGAGTVMVPDHVREGHHFAIICSHCGGSGFAPVTFAPKRREPLPPVDESDDIPF